MVRSAFSKVAWVGRTASMVFGLALVMALVIGAASTAWSATGGNFILGKANGADRVSKLTASIAGPALTLVNNSTDAAATALNISVASDKAPLKVNAAAGTAKNLSADELDGKSSEQFANAAHPHSGEDITSGTVADARIDGTVARDGEVMPTVTANDGAGSGLDADTVDGKHAADFYAAGSKVADSSHADQADSATNAQNAQNATNAQNAAKLGGVEAGEYQRKCQKGAVTGHVVVYNPSTLPNSWTEANNSYLNSYNCTGQPIRIIRHGAGRYSVQFVGQEYMGRTAVVSVESGYGRNDAFANTSYVFHYGDGIIARDVNIRTHDGTFVDSSFQLVAFQ